MVIRHDTGDSLCNIKHTTRMNVCPGRTDHAPECKLAPTFAFSEGGLEGGGVLRGASLTRA